jgi:hypothetical protein
MSGLGLIASFFILSQMLAVFIPVSETRAFEARGFAAGTSG